MSRHPALTLIMIIHYIIGGLLIGCGAMLAIMVGLPLLGGAYALLGMSLVTVGSFIRLAILIETNTLVTATALSKMYQDKQTKRTPKVTQLKRISSD